MICMTRATRSSSAVHTTSSALRTHTPPGVFSALTTINKHATPWIAEVCHNKVHALHPVALAFARNAICAALLAHFIKCTWSCAHGLSLILPAKGAGQAQRQRPGKY